LCLLQEARLMQSHIRAAVAASFAAFALWPLSAGASTVIIGNGLAHDCSVQALSGAHDVETVALCSRALEEETLTTPDYAKTLANRGIVTMRRANVADAAKDFARAEMMAPTLPEIYINRAVMLMK